MMFSVNGRSIPQKFRDRKRRDAIPDTIADKIVKSDTIYVLNVERYEQIGISLFEVWRYDGNIFEYQYDGEDRLSSFEKTDESELLEKIIAKDFTYKENLQYPTLAILNAYKFVRVSSTLFEFEKQSYYADIEIGEVYAPNR